MNTAAKSRNRPSIRSNAEFQSIYKTGVKCAIKGLRIFAKPCRDGQPPRVGVVASAKAVGNAVMRNRCKRRLRALARSVIAVSANPAYDYVLVATSDCATRTLAELEKDLQACLGRLKLLS